MIARLLSAGITLVVYFSAATLTAEMILGGYLWIAWKMDRDRAVQMLAIAQGIDLFAAARSHGQDKDDPGAEQPSLKQLIAARVAKDLDLTIREQTLRNGKNQLASSERQLADKQDKFKRAKDAYETQLQELMSAEKVAGREKTQMVLGSLKAAQAKQQIALMIENDQMDEVVLLLVDMPSRPQSKIFAEFKSPEEQEQLAEILGMIREGRPAVTLAEQAAGELAQGNP